MNADLLFAPTQDERHLLDEIATREADLARLVAAWAEINSGSGNREGLDRMRDRVAAQFAQLGAEVSEVALPPSEVVEADGSTSRADYAPAIQIVCRPEAPMHVALTGHYDTVFPADSPFQHVGRIDTDRLRGPGVADMKGGLVVMFEALRALERSPHASRLGWKVLISPDEELGSPGSRSALAELGAWAHAGMTFEPALADGCLAGARKGSGRFALVVHGRSAHAGREPHRGRNAIAAAARFAAAVDALNGSRGGTTFNVARIEGGGPLNIVPDLAVCRFEIRVPSASDGQWGQSEVERLVRSTVENDGLAARLFGGITRPPKPLAPENRRLLEFTREVGRALGLDLGWRDTGGACEGNNLWGAGCPNVDTLGVRGGGTHSDQEFLVLPSLVERSQLSALMLMKMATGVFDVRGLQGAPS